MLQKVSDKKVRRQPKPRRVYMSLHGTWAFNHSCHVKLVDRAEERDQFEYGLERLLLKKKKK